MYVLQLEGETGSDITFDFEVFFSQIKIPCNIQLIFILCIRNEGNWWFKWLTTLIMIWIIIPTGMIVIIDIVMGLNSGTLSRI